MNTKSNMLKALALALGVLYLGLAGARADDASRLRTERGTIKSVDQEHRSLVLTGHKAKTEHTFQWNDQTKFTEGSKAASATDLKAGEHALIHYEAGKGVATMKSISLTPANAASSMHRVRLPAERASNPAQVSLAERVAGSPCAASTLNPPRS